MGDLQSADYHLGIAECLNDATEQKPLITATKSANSCDMQHSV